MNGFQNYTWQKLLKGKKTWQVIVPTLDSLMWPFPFLDVYLNMMRGLENVLEKLRATGGVTSLDP